MPQLSYQNELDKGFEGQIINPHSSFVTSEVIEGVNISHVSTYSVDAATDGDHTIVVDGVSVTFTASSNTVEEIRNGLLANVIASSFATAIVTASADAGDVSLLLLTAVESGVLVTITESSANGSISVTTTHQKADEIAFGRVLVYTSNDTVSLPSDASQKIAGVSTGSVLESVKETGKRVYTKTNNPDIPSIRRGQVRVIAEDIVTKGGDVFYRTVINGSTEQGAVRSDNDSGNATQLTSARFAETTTATEQLVVLDINLP